MSAKNLVFCKFSKIFAKYLIACFAKFSWNFAKFCKIQNNFVKISCFAKFLQCCFAATLCRGGGGRGGGEWGVGGADMYCLAHPPCWRRLCLYRLPFLLFSILLSLILWGEHNYWYTVLGACFDYLKKCSTRYTYIRYLESESEPRADGKCAGSTKLVRRLQHLS